jgi:hypothetical protein
MHGQRLARPETRKAFPMTYAILTSSRVYGPAPFVAFEFKTKAKALQEGAA